MSEVISASLALVRSVMTGLDVYRSSSSSESDPSPLVLVVCLPSSALFVRPWVVGRVCMDCCVSSGGRTVGGWRRTIVVWSVRSGAAPARRLVSMCRLAHAISVKDKRSTGSR